MIAFLTSFSGVPLGRSSSSFHSNSFSQHSQRRCNRVRPSSRVRPPPVRRKAAAVTARLTSHTHNSSSSSAGGEQQMSRAQVQAQGHGAKKTRRIAVVGKKLTIEKKEVTVDVEEVGKGLFGMRANAYWDSIGTLPLVFAGVGVAALVIKMVKVRGGGRVGGTNGDGAVNTATLPKSAITSQEEEAELHVFKCGGCGYEMYPARGRESRFFPDGFRCPMCGTPKEQFWDLNDPNDPRNQEDDDEDDEDEDGGSDSDDDDDGSDNGPKGSDDDGDGIGQAASTTTESTKPAIASPATGTSTGSSVQMSADPKPDSNSNSSSS